MKISYNDISLEKDFKHFEEWYSLCTGINAIKKKGYFGNSNFIGKNIFFLLVYVLVFIIMINIYKSSDELFLNILGMSLIVVSSFAIISYVLAFIGYFIYYRSFKKTNTKKRKNSLTVSEEGIIDITDDITLTSKWEQLTHVLIGEYYIMIATMANIVYIFPVDIKDKLLSGLKKYNTNKKLNIIEKNI